MVVRTLVATGMFLSLLCSSTASIKASPPPFEEMLRQWLYQIGFKGEVLETSKVYDEDRFLNYFKLILKEDSASKIHVELASNDKYEFANIKMLGKDLKGLPYMHADWIARMVVSVAIQKISKTLGLEYEIDKIRGGLYRATIEPTKTTVPSRFRFNQIEIFYEVHDLVLSIDATIKGPKDYIALQFAKSELNAVLRALENGHFPGSSELFLTSALSRGSGSDYLLHKILKVEEASRETTAEP